MSGATYIFSSAPSARDGTTCPVVLPGKAEPVSRKTVKKKLTTQLPGRAKCCKLKEQQPLRYMPQIEGSYIQRAMVLLDNIDLNGKPIGPWMGGQWIALLGIGWLGVLCLLDRA